MGIIKNFEDFSSKRTSGKVIRGVNDKPFLKAPSSWATQSIITRGKQGKRMFGIVADNVIRFPLA